MSSCADVSFVIPTYNRPDFLSETIGSVLAQTRPPREIIVVDNSTTAKAAEILEPFRDNVRLIHSQPGSLQLARNAGIEAAASEWIALLDDDDLVRPTYLEEAAPIMADERVDLIGTDHLRFNENGPNSKTNFEEAPPGYWEAVREVAGAEYPHFIGKFPLANLLKRNPIYPSMMIIRRNFALSIGGYDQTVNRIPAEDIEFLTRALNHGNVGLVTKPLVDYRVHLNNHSGSSANREVGRWRIFEYIRWMSDRLPEEFLLALDADLPRRRVQVFKIAFRTGDRRLMEEVLPLIAPADLSPGLRTRNLISKLPRTIAAMFRFGQSRERLGEWSRESLIARALASGRSPQGLNEQRHILD